MSVSHGPRQFTGEESRAWWPVARGLILIAAWLALFLLFARTLPALVDWVSDQADRGWLVPTLAGWALFAVPALVGAAVTARETGWGFLGRCLVAVSLVPAVAFLPGRLTTTRERWEHVASSGGFHFHRAVQWTFLGELLLLVVLAFVVLRRLHDGRSGGRWAATAILLPPPLIMLGVLLVAGR